MPKRRNQQTEDEDLVARDGAFVLTFLNTGSRRSRRLRDYADLVAWSGLHGALSAPEASRLERLAAERPEDADAAFAAAERLHSLVSRIVNAAVDRKRLPAEDVRGLNLLLASVVPRQVLVADGARRLKWDWPEDAEDDLCRPLWPVAVSAMDLVTSEACGKVQRCAARGCDVLFLKTGGGMYRKWCSAKSCGDPERSRRFYRSVTKPRNAARHARVWNKARRKAD